MVAAVAACAFCLADDEARQAVAVVGVAVARSHAGVAVVHLHVEVYVVEAEAVLELQALVGALTLLLELLNVAMVEVAGHGVEVAVVAERVDSIVDDEVVVGREVPFAG